jgi:flagellar protein FliT
VGAVSQFYELTVELIRILSSAKERDGKIDRVQSLLDQRESLMKEMVPPYTPDEVEVGQKLIQLNSRLMQLLQTEKILIQKDIKDLQTKKESNTKYVNPYQNLSTDGMFYDKRN